MGKKGNPQRSKDFRCSRCDKQCSNCEMLQERIWDLEFQLNLLREENDRQFAQMCSDWEDNKPERF